MPHTLNSRVRNIFEAQLLRPAHKPGTYEYRLDALMNYQPLLTYRAWDKKEHAWDIQLRFAPFPGDLGSVPFPGLEDFELFGPGDICMQAWRCIQKAAKSGKEDEQHFTASITDIFVYLKEDRYSPWCYIGRLNNVPFDATDEDLSEAGYMVFEQRRSYWGKAKARRRALQPDERRNALDYTLALDRFETSKESNQSFHKEEGPVLFARL